MKTTRAFTTISAILFVLTVAYAGSYVASVTRMQISYGNPSGPLLAVYDHTWQRALFRPIEHVDRRLFPARWRYDQLKATDTPTR